MPEFTGKVSLLANYLPDEQESMQRFAQTMWMGLRARGIEAEIIRPEPVFSKTTGEARGFSKWLRYADKFIAFPRRLKSHLRTLGRAGVLHVCDHSSAVYTKYAAGTPHLVTCHDVLAIRSARGEIPENPTRFTGRLYQRKILNGLQRAQRVVCVSNATRSELQRVSNISPDRIAVVQNGLNHSFGLINRAEAWQRITKSMGKLSRRFILHVGGNQWYKNRAGVIGIYAKFIQMLPEGPDLFLVGKPLPPALEAQIDAAKIRDRVHSFCDCDNEVLRAFYAAADALLFPSLAEGFGWPIIEAQACGCVVVTSAMPPMNDIGGAAAFYIDPRDLNGAAAKLRDVLWESGLDQALRKKDGFTNAARFAPDRMIDGYVEQYELVAGA